MYTIPYRLGMTLISRQENGTDISWIGNSSYREFEKGQLNKIRFQKNKKNLQIKLNIGQL